MSKLIKMKGCQILLCLSFIGMSCTPHAVVKPGVNFSKIRTVSVTPIHDFESVPGSGEIVSRSLVHHLMKIGMNVVEREKMNYLLDEASLGQTALAESEYNVQMASPDAIVLCTITEFSDSREIVIPIKTTDQGRTVTTVEEKKAPVVVASNEKEDKEIVYQTTTTEETTYFKGSITETSRVEYVNSVVGITLQMVNKETGEVIWSSNYWFNSLNLSRAVDQCVAGALKPLKKLLEQK